MHQGRLGAFWSLAARESKERRNGQDMVVAGSIMLIGGIAGIVVLLALNTWRPRMFSRGVTVWALAGLFLLAGAGLILLTAVMGGQSLHTGG
ncbi:MAG: hypothetical protein HZB44_01360 [Actinobacteria bacterium]|nr:hypothetical protein [Actinomycetota bacterium]